MITNYLKKNTSRFLWTVIFISFLCFFRVFINATLNLLFVNPLISKFDNTATNGVIVFIFSLCIILLIVIYASRIFARQTAIFVLGLFAFNRSSGYWTFYPLAVYPYFMVWDVIVFALSIPALIAIFPARKRKTEYSDQGFLEDLPIQDEKGDSFDRRGLATAIAEKINFTSNSRSFAIGILGEYGSGKTSFMNLIKCGLDGSRTSYMNFNPWSVEGKSNMQQDFFDQLSTMLRKSEPRLSGLVLDYSRKLARSESSFSKTIKQTGLLASLFSESNYIDDYEVINNLLLHSKKKIVVAIDDLDRLYNDEVLEILRIIRNTGNFANIFYLVSYDRSYVENAVASLNADVGHNFLDKIIQFEVPLPKREVDSLGVILEGHLKKFLSTKDLKDFHDNIVLTGFHKDYDFAYHRIFRQSRDIIKFINGMRIAYDKLKEEVFFENLFVLELLKFRFPSVYDMLYENRKDFVHSQAFADLHEQYYELSKYMENDESKISIIRSLRKMEKYSEADLDLIAGLLHHLFFPVKRIMDAKNSIIYPMYFERYFRYRLSGKELSETAFEIALKGGLVGMMHLVDSCAAKGMLQQAAVRIIQQNISNKEELELLVQTIFYLGPKFAEQEGLREFSFDSIVSIFIMDRRNHYVSFYEDGAQGFGTFAERMFEMAPFPYLFHNELVYHIKKEGSPFAVSKERLTDFQVMFFMKHLERDGLSEDAVYIFFWTSHEKFEPLQNDPSRGNNQRYIEQKMASVMKDALPSHNPINFLKMSIKSDGRDNTHFGINRTMLKIFTNPTELRIAVASNNFLDECDRTQYLEFFDACSQNNFANLVEFSFTGNLSNKLETSISF